MSQNKTPSSIAGITQGDCLEGGLDLRDTSRAQLVDAFLWPQTIEKIQQAAKAQQLAYYRVDLSAFMERTGMLQALAATLALPDYFGHNWDALEECLVDPSWFPPCGMVLVVQVSSSVPAFPESFAMLREILTSVSAYWRQDGLPFWIFWLSA